MMFVHWRRMSEGRRFEQYCFCDHLDLIKSKAAFKNIRHVYFDLIDDDEV